MDTDQDGVIDPEETGIPDVNVVVIKTSVQYPCGMGFGYDPFGQSDLGWMESNYSGTHTCSFNWSGGIEDENESFLFYWGHATVVDTDDTPACIENGKRVKVWTVARQQETGEEYRSTIKEILYTEDLPPTSIDLANRSIMPIVEGEPYENPVYFDVKIKRRFQEWSCDLEEWRPTYANDYSFDSNDWGCGQNNVPVLRARTV